MVKSKNGLRLKVFKKPQAFDRVNYSHLGKNFSRLLLFRPLTTVVKTVESFYLFIYTFSRRTFLDFAKNN